MQQVLQADDAADQGRRLVLGLPGLPEVPGPDHEEAAGTAEAAQGGGGPASSEQGGQQQDSRVWSPADEAWGNAAGHGRKCLLCKAELSTEGAAAGGGRSKGQAKSSRSSQKERLDELEECLEQIHQQIGQTEVEVRAAAALLEEATKCEEGTRKALVRTAKAKLTSLAMAHLEVAKNLVREEKARSQAAAGRPSRSD